jgi:hypothetical protein
VALYQEDKMIVPYEQAIQEITDVINKSLFEMPDDETRQAVLDAFSKQMFCDTRKEQEK